jgi:hypothetical protein
MEPVSDEAILGATCDEGGEAPCFAHLVDEAGDDDEDAGSGAQKRSLRGNGRPGDHSRVENGRGHRLASGTATAE